MSLRTTISLVLLAMLLAVGAAASGLAYEATLYEAGQFMDDQMRQLAAVVDEATLPGAIGALQEPEDRFAVTVWTRDGRRVVLSPPDEEAMPTAMGLGHRRDRDGEVWRTFARRDSDRTVFVAQRMSARDEVAIHAALEVALPILASVALAWLIVFAVVGRLLRSLIRLGREIEASGSLPAQPLPSVRIPSELLPFVAAINGSFDRLQGALEQQRRFIADSAHQLRTPLAAMRLQIDNLSGLGLADPATAPLRDGMRRVGVMLNQLLELARFDGPDGGGRAETVDLTELLTECVADHVELAEERGIDLGVGSIEPVSARLVRADVALLLTNVIENAIRYTPPGGKVDCSLIDDGEGRGVLSVVDTGPGVPPEELPRLTERFYRGRTVESVGSGLGLAIVQAAADRNHLDLTITNRRDRSGLSLVLVVPSGSRCHPPPDYAR